MDNIITTQETSKDIQALMAFIDADGESLKTDSRHVADTFGKNHKNVLRMIATLMKSESDFAGLNFELCYENNDLQNGKANKFYRMTKDGFMFLVMGFTGEKARKTKIAFIQAFNIMQHQIAEKNETLIRKFFHLVEKENQSFAVASMAGRVLQNRKGQKEDNQAEMSYLQKQIQPDLFDTPERLVEMEEEASSGGLSI